MRLKKKIILLGFQRASLNNLKDALNFYYKKKIKIIDYNFFNFEKKKNKFILKKKHKLFIEKKLNSCSVILGTSETSLEGKLANYFKKLGIFFFTYVDSNTNINLRFKNFQNIPQDIIVNNNLIKKKLVKFFQKKKIKIKFYNVNMIYQRMLKKKFFNKNRTDQILLYLTSDHGIDLEKKNIYRLKNYFSSTLRPKIIVNLHPREKLVIWKKFFKKEKNIKITQGINYYNSKKILNVYGISTMALINYKFCGFRSFYFCMNKKKKDPFNDLLQIYKIKPIKYN